MPNWCSNNLSFYGMTEDMNKLLNVIKKEEADCGYELLEKLYSTPQELLNVESNFSKDITEQQQELINKYGAKDWYDWRIHNWGCKWSESELQIGQELTTYDSGKTCIAFNFDTPWGPPLEAFDKISMDYPNILICLYYEEPGMGFCGRTVWANGERQESEQSDLIGDYFDEQDLFDEYVTLSED